MESKPVSLDHLNEEIKISTAPKIGMETSPPASKFRFRDHGDDMENGESVIDDTSSEPSSVTSDEDSDIDSDELASMTAKGINHLCLELIELKQASEVDFKDNIISNYLSFIRVFKETEAINSEVMRLKYHLMSQKQLVQNLMDAAYLKSISDDQNDTVLDDQNDQNPTTFFKTCADEVLETLDNLLFEHRLEEALKIFEIEDGNSPKVRFQENIPPDVWMCFKSDMAERRVKLADKLTLVADNTRISSSELQKSLVGLSQLGFDHLATRLFFKYYHTRITSIINNLHSSPRFLPGIHIHDLAKHVFSMIFQASRSFVMLHGESLYDSELMKWACEETEAFASCFNRHVELISQTGDGLSMVVNSFHSAMSYCSMLETQKLSLQPCLIEHILPCIEEILKTHFEHFKKVTSMFMCNDVWVMGRYLVSGILTNGSFSLDEYCLLTNSGRKFMILLQNVIEDVSSLVSVLGSSILEELFGLFTHYTSILETVIKTNDVIEGELRIKKAESLSEKVSVFANLSTLERFFFIMIKNLFKDMNELKTVIEGHVASVKGSFSRIRSQLCKQFIHGIMSNEASCISDHGVISLLQDLMPPSLPYQILFLEIRKVEELAEENVDEYDWLVSLLIELIETTFDWISRNYKIRITNDNKSGQQFDDLTQFAVDVQFVVEIARRGGYVTEKMLNSSKDLVLEMESEIVSDGFDLNRYVVDYEKVAMEAIEGLEALDEEKWKSDDEGSQVYELYFSSESIVEGDDDNDDTERVGEVDLERRETSDDVCTVKGDVAKEEVSLRSSDELLEVRKKIRRFSKVVREQE